MTRDDRDRLLVAGGLAWLWFVTPFSLFAQGPVMESSTGLVVYVLALPALLILAALALWRHVAAARLPLVALALALAGGAFLLVGRFETTLVIAAGSLVVAAGAARLRIPPERVDSRTARRAGVGRAGAESAGTWRESIAWEAAAIGNDAELLAFLDAAAHLDRERTRVLAAAWHAVDPAARRAAWIAVRREAEQSGRTAALDELRREIELWGRAAGGSAWTWEWASMTDVDRSDVRRAAMPGLLDAAAATLLRDRLDGRDRDVLLGPWQAAVTDPGPDDVADGPSPA